jgi:hypothetical protein
VSEAVTDEGVEPMCETTGKPCEWAAEDDLDGGWDLFCLNCYRFRDWSREEAEDPEAPEEKT